MFLGETIIEANCTNEDSQANLINVKWGFGPSFDSKYSGLLTCFADIYCTSVDNTSVSCVIQQ